jgi:hypothetical protein
VGAFDSTGSEIDRRTRNSRNTEHVEACDRTDDVNDRVHCAYFMKVDVVPGHTVDRCFGFGKPLEDLHALFFY